jgi:molybdate transport system substrate-binding protein
VEADMANRDVKIISTGGLKAAVSDLVDAFAQATGDRLVPIFASPAVVKGRIEAGEAVDVAVLSAALIDDLVRQGKLATRIDVSRSRMGLAVRAGAPKPDISTVEAFRQTMLNAKSIMYTDPKAGGASGVHFAKVIERLGIADQVNAKTKLNSGGFNAEFVARGEIELGIQQVSEIVPVKGAELAGLFPEELQNVTTFSAAVCASAPEPDAAAGLLRFLKSPAAVRVIEANGMEPC